MTKPTATPDKKAESPEQQPADAVVTQAAAVVPPAAAPKRPRATKVKAVEPAPVATAVPAEAPAVTPAPAKVAKKSAGTPTGARKAAATPTPAPSAAKADKPTKPGKSVKADKPAKPPKAAKIKMVRDSFTMPSDEWALIDQVKLRALEWRMPVKKSEVLRAALHALMGLSDARLKETLAGLAPIKKGRPSKA
jgi:hypothetical protein